MMNDADDPVLNGADSIAPPPVWTPAMEEALVASAQQEADDLKAVPDEPLTEEEKVRKAEWDACVPDAPPAPRSREELWAIALDMASGKLFTSLHLEENEHHLIGMVFMPLGLTFDLKTLKYFAEHVEMFYEDLSKAMPRSVNGLPMFGSMHLLLKNEAAVFWPLYDEALKRIDVSTPPPAVTP